MITGLQLRAARKLLNWTPDRVARRARVAVGLIVLAEQRSGEMPMAPMVARTLRQIFENEGIEFSEDPTAPARWRGEGGGTPSASSAP